ncbi:MAG TPA: RsmE family RNA methyltransferase, partial [Spirochaetales bacterium]|nr:RsmE family RNA methyltransferase [Spirochaetales bacterium]
GKLEIDPHIPIVLAIGSERGWTEHEVSLLEEHGFKRVGLGTRILRTETACTVALAILAAKLGYL